MTAHGCPEALRDAFLELLSRTLVDIRNHSSDAGFCHALAHHVHNVPALLGRFHRDRLAFYWEVERPGFLEALEAMGRRPPKQFDEAWEVIGREYRRLGGPAAS
jgi:hypothetical protein